jgi:hypothetical protein
LSAAFTKEDSAETASETLLPDRPVAPHPNLVTEAGLKALEFQLQQAREAYDVNKRSKLTPPRLRPERGYRLVRMRGPSASVQPCSSNAAYAARACGCTSASFSHDVVG